MSVDKILRGLSNGTLIALIEVVALECYIEQFNWDFNNFLNSTSVFWLIAFDLFVNNNSANFYSFYFTFEEKLKKYFT